MQAFADAKRERGVIDFADQMQIAATLVLGHPRIGVALREQVPGRAARRVPGHRARPAGHPARAVRRRRAPTARAGHPVTAVGDPVQSIYSWRGASASNLPRFVTDFPQASGAPAPTRSLLTSFRNPPSVLSLANAMSADDPDRARRRRSRSANCGRRTRRRAGEVRYGLFPTVADEDAWLARSIAERWKAAMDGPEPAPPTTAVLLRRRSDMAATAEALRAAGLPVEVVGLGGLLDEPEIADLVATLRILVDPTAGAAAIRLLTGARWQLGVADLEALAQRARDTGPDGRPPATAGPGPAGTRCGPRWPRRCPGRTSIPGAWSTPSPTRARRRTIRRRVTAG